MSTIQAGNLGSMPTDAGRDLRTDIVTGDGRLARLVDRVRWGPVIAGLFTSLATLAVLGVLGIAIGMSAADAGDDARNFGIGAGIWGIISALVAFFIGGWIASRTTSYRNAGWGTLHGAMVWMVAIPLLMYFLASGATTIAGGAAGEATRALTDNTRDLSAAVNTDTTRNGTTADDTRLSSRQEAAANTGARAAWGTLVSMLLGLGAACAGGYFGSRGNDNDDDARSTRASYGTTTTPAV